jgi:transcriptional regulator with XRE-family HTH domain
MSSPIGQRIFIAHLELSYRLGRKVTLAEFGEMVAAAMARDVPFSAAAVSRWEKGTKVPGTQVIEAIAAVTGVDPGWLSHGDKTAAPRPRSQLADAQPPAAPAPIPVADAAERVVERDADDDEREGRTGERIADRTRRDG